MALGYPCGVCGSAVHESGGHPIPGASELDAVGHVVPSGPRRMARVITLPNGRRVSLRVYVAAWKRVLGIPGPEFVTGFFDFAATADEIRAELSRGTMDRI